MAHLNVQVRLVNQAIKRGLCAGMLETIRKKPLPLLTSYMTSPIAADRAGHERIYCIFRSVFHVLKKEIPTLGSGRKTLTLTFAVGGAGAQR